MRAKTGTRQHTLTYAAHAPPGTWAEHRACFTPKRSLVRTQYRPPTLPTSIMSSQELIEALQKRSHPCRLRAGFGRGAHLRGPIHMGRPRLVCHHRPGTPQDRRSPPYPITPMCLPPASPTATTSSPSNLSSREPSCCRPAALAGGGRARHHRRRLRQHGNADPGRGRHRTRRVAALEEVVIGDFRPRPWSPPLWSQSCGGYSTHELGMA